MYGRWLRNSFIYLLILVAIVAIVFTLFGQGGGSSDIESSPSLLIEEVRANRVNEIIVNGDTVSYKLVGAEETSKFEKEKR